MRRPTALLLAYDGTPFKGWQIQRGKPTIQGAIEEVLSTALDMKVQVYGAARTDAGVHAEGQVCHFLKEKIDSTSALVELMVALPKLLPGSIRLLRAALAHPSFHARSSSIGKRYRYRWTWGTKRAQDEARSYWLGAMARPDWERAREALAGLLDLGELPGLSSPSSDQRAAPGIGGFRLTEARAEANAMANANAMAEANAMANANANAMLNEGTMADALLGSTATLELWGPAFRKHQVRNMAGHLAAIALGLAKPESLRTLAQRKRPWIGAQAPARGLTLVEVVYPAGLGPFEAENWETGAELTARLSAPDDE